MLAIKYVITLLALLSIISFLIVSHFQSEGVAAGAIILCVTYNMIDIFQGSNRDSIAGSDIELNSQCIIGDTKQPNGFLSGGCWDIWHIYHVLFWIIMGLLAPNWYIAAAILSISWEFTEHIMFKFWFSRCDSIFCGRLEDIAFNMIGYVIGSYVAANL